MKRSHYCQYQSASLRFLLLVSFAVCFSSIAAAQQIVTVVPSGTPNPESESLDQRYGVWNTQENAAGKRFEEMRLRVYPAPEPVPAFRQRLIPASKDRVDGNAALFYLKAMGFFEQHNAREQLNKLQRKYLNEATESQRDAGDYPPNNWSDAPLESLPMDQVREYLELHYFQPEFLYDAARRTRFEHDRAIEREPNPLGYLLPSIQQHRELARVQKLRCRYAIAQGRIDDATEIVGQMLAMGQHLGSDEFLVSSLVGVAIQGIGVGNGLELSQHPDTPNLYWAIAACPKPMIDLRRSLKMESEFLFLQIPILRQVTEKVRPVEFWVDFTKQFVPAINELVPLVTNSFDGGFEQWDYFKAATSIARDYPVARDFLNQVVGLSEEKLDRYPKAQVVFLAVVKYYEFVQDELMKQYVVPYPSRLKLRDSYMAPWIAKFRSNNDSLLFSGEALLPAIDQIHDAVARAEQLRNLWQTVEALRMTAAKNDGTLPDSLEQLVVPAPLDPATNQPFEYEVNGKVATVRGAKIRSTYQIKLELAERSPQKEKTE